MKRVVTPRDKQLPASFASLTTTSTASLISCWTGCGQLAGLRVVAPNVPDERTEEYRGFAMPLTYAKCPWGDDDHAN